MDYKFTTFKSVSINRNCVWQCKWLYVSVKKTHVSTNKLRSDKSTYAFYTDLINISFSNILLFKTNISKHLVFVAFKHLVFVYFKHLVFVYFKHLVSVYFSWLKTRILESKDTAVFVADKDVLHQCIFSHCCINMMYWYGSFKGTYCEDAWILVSAATSVQHLDLLYPQFMEVLSHGTNACTHLRANIGKLR